MDTATKTRINAAKTASKRVVQKTAEATGDLIRIKQLIKLLQQLNQKKRKKQEKQKKFTFHQKKDSKSLMTLDCFVHNMWHHCIKMEFQKITNFLDATSDDKDLSRFVTKKWIEVYDQSGGNYNVNKKIRIKTSMLRSDLCHFSDAYIVVKRTITVTGPDNAKRNRATAFKNNAPFINCISKMDGVKIDNAEDLDVVMPIQML